MPEREPEPAHEAEPEQEQVATAEPEAAAHDEASPNGDPVTDKLEKAVRELEAAMRETVMSAAAQAEAAAKPAAEERATTEEPAARTEPVTETPAARTEPARTEEPVARTEPVTETPAARTEPAARPQPASTGVTPGAELVRRIAPPEEPRIRGPLESVLRHPFLTLLPLVLLLGGAIYLGTTRDPEYTAEARVAVGRADIPAQVLQNAAYGNQVLAGSFAGAIAAPSVIDAAARKAGTTPADARSRLSASIIPESTLIGVEAEGSSERDAVVLANAGATELIDYVEEVSRTDRSQSLFRRFRQAQADVRRLEGRLATLKRRNASRERVARAQLEVDAAELEASQLANLYRGETTTDTTTGAHLTALAPAADAESDKRDVLERLIIIAVAGGLVLGIALALLRTNWGVLRARRG